MTFTCSRRTLLAGALATAAGAALPGRSNAAWAPDLPPLSDPDWWWGIFRDLTLMGLGSLPGIGGVASYFGALFLPQSLFTRPDEQWQRYVQAINTIVDARIADAIYLQVSARLQGISQALRLYQQAQDAGDAAHLRAVEDAVNVTLTTAMPDFMLAGQEYRLLPLFVPAANLHLGLLRQAALRARQQGASAVAEDFSRQLSAALDDYGRYYDTTVALRLQQEARGHPHDAYRQRSEPLAAVLQLRTQLQLSLGDVRDCWPWFDAQRHPGPVRPRLDREVFSPLLGSWYDDTQVMPSTLPARSAPTGPIQVVRTGGFLFVDGLALGYADGQGPGGTSQTVIGGSGGRWNTIGNVVERGHIVAAEVRSGYAVNALNLEFGDGSQSSWVGDAGDGAAGAQRTRVQLAGHRISSVMGFGTAAGYGGVLSGCVFGLQLLAMEAPATLDAGVRHHLRRAWPAMLDTLPRR